MTLEAPDRPTTSSRTAVSLTSTRVAFACLAIVALYAATRLLFITRFPYFLDEGTYAVFTYEGSRSLDGLFSSYSIAREPLMFWLGIPWVKLGFNPLDAVRIVSVIAGLLTVGVVGLLARRLGGTVAGLAAAALCVVLPFFVVHDGIGIIEPLVTLVMAAALLLQLELARRPELRVGVLLGLVLAAGVLTKENTRPALALIPLSLICFDWSPADRRRRLGRWLGGVGIAVAMAAAAYLALRLPSQYDQFEAARNDPLQYTVKPLGDVLSDPFDAVGPAWKAYRPAFWGYVTLPLFIAAVAGAVLGLRSQWRPTIVMLGWIALPFAVSMLFSTAPFPRHVMYMLPPAVVFMGFAMAEGLGWLQRALGAGRGAAVAGVAALLALAPALALDARVLAHPDTARYPGSDDLQYVTGTGAGSVWPEMADIVERRARDGTVVILAPNAFTQVLEMLLGPDPRYKVVIGTSPLAKRAQFAVLDEIPFLDATAAKIIREQRFVLLKRFPRPRGGAVARLRERPSSSP